MAYRDDPVDYSNDHKTATWGPGGPFAPGVYDYLKVGRPGIPGTDQRAGVDAGSWAWVLRAAPVPSPSGPVNVPAVTGVSPTETSYALYGHPVPLSVFGVGRIGGDIIAGPWMANGAASFCISFGVPADPYGSRTVKEIAFDSEVVWTEADGFSAEGFTFRWYPGTLTQAADPLEISHFGASAVAYRPQMLLWFENLPLASTKFSKIPYVAALIEDGSGRDVNLGEAFERLAYSPWVGYTSAQFETVGMTDVLVDGGMIIAQPAEFLSTIQQFTRFYRSWDILQTDKLRIVDRGAAVTADINLNLSRMSGQVVLSRAATDSVPRVLELSTIDPEADYTIVPSTASRPRDPVAVTTSVATEAAFLPIIMDSHTRMSLVTYAKYQEEVARKKVAGTAMMYGLEIEPGDLVALLDLGDDFVDEVFKVIETTHGANYAVEFVLESILRCALFPDDGTDPWMAYVVLLMGFEGVNGSTGAPGFTDESPQLQGTATVTGGPTITTAQHKYGLSSLLITGSLPQVQFSSSSDYDLSNSNSDKFTIECWARFDSFTQLPEHSSLVGKQFSGVDWRFAAISNDGPGDIGELMFQSSSTSGVINVDVRSSGANLVKNVWHHLAVDKDVTGKIRLYANGVMVGSDTPADSSIFYNLLNQLTIGSRAFGGSPLHGYLDEIRITKGIARYATDGAFTSPTDAFPRPGDT